MGYFGVVWFCSVLQSGFLTRYPPKSRIAENEVFGIYITYGTTCAQKNGLTFSDIPPIELVRRFYFRRALVISRGGVYKIGTF